MGLRASACSVPGTIRQEVVIDGRHRLVTDQPAGIGGTDLGPSPHELLPAALAACTVWALVRYAQTKGWELGDVTVAVDYDHQSTPRRFQTVIRLGGDLAASSSSVSTRLQLPARFGGRSIPGSSSPSASRRGARPRSHGRRPLCRQPS